MGRFSQVSLESFDEFQTEAGVLLNSFNPENPELSEDAIICATTGGINPSCTPTFEDYGEDVDNCAPNLLELKKLTGWNCSLVFTALNVTPEVIKLALGAADIDASTGKITPRIALSTEDFNDVWWVGDRTDGGLVAIKLVNALSTSGMSLQTTKNGKGQISVTLAGHVSANDQEVVPMEFYVQEGTE